MLEIRNLTCGYDQQFLLKDINFNLAAQEFIGIIGPNGSGKTTLLRAITKVIPPKAGDMFFEGKEIVRMNFKELAQSVAIVSQNIQPEFNLSVEEFVALGRTPHQQRFQFFESKHDQEIIRQAMDLTGTLRFRRRLVRHLSGGERQLVVIAKALAQQPKLLLLDEPTVFLDISHQVEILDLIKRLNTEKGLSVIIVLHELNLASEYCDRLILLNKGYIHSIGTPKQVLDYKIIEQVYRTTVVVENSPASGNPYVFIVPGKQIK